VTRVGVIGWLGGRVTVQQVAFPQHGRELVLQDGELLARDGQIV